MGSPGIGHIDTSRDALTMTLRVSQGEQRVSPFVEFMHTIASNEHLMLVGHSSYLAQLPLSKSWSQFVHQSRGLPLLSLAGQFQAYAFLPSIWPCLSMNSIPTQCLAYRPNKCRLLGNLVGNSILHNGKQVIASFEIAWPYSSSTPFHQLGTTAWSLQSCWP